MDQTQTQTVFNVLSAVVGSLASLIFSYVPYLRDWYAKLKPGYKRLVMFIIILASSLLILGSSCLDLWPVIVCRKEGFLVLAEAFFLALVANQATYLISEPVKSVKEIKDALSVKKTT